jgi:orotate phosphoribosyltransferase
MAIIRARLNACPTRSAGRRGHFVFESGHHGELWLDLDALILRPAALMTFARELARRLAAHRFEAVVDRQMLPISVGYAIPDTLQPHLRGRSVAIVNGAISAGSATSSTYAVVTAFGARTVAVGALLILGETALPFLAASGVAVASIARLPNELWPPDDCPLCAAGVPISNLSAAD